MSGGKPKARGTQVRELLCIFARGRMALDAVSNRFVVPLGPAPPCADPPVDPLVGEAIVNAGETSLNNLITFKRYIKFTSACSV